MHQKTRCLGSAAHLKDVSSFFTLGCGLVNGNTPFGQNTALTPPGTGVSGTRTPSRARVEVEMKVSGAHEPVLGWHGSCGSTKFRTARTVVW